jgi:hypothetical protein
MISLKSARNRTYSLIFVKWKKWSRRFFHFSFDMPTFAKIGSITLLKEKVIMKRMMLLLAFSGLLTTAMADWTYGTARFTGSQPSSCLHHGTVIIWYNGTLTQKGVSGNEEIWEGTGDICVLYPKNYSGRQLRITSTGGTVQIQTLR